MPPGLFEFPGYRPAHLLLLERFHAGFVDACEQRIYAAIIVHDHLGLRVFSRRERPRGDQITVVVVFHDADALAVRTLEGAVVATLAAHGQIGVAPFVA